jgi:hypothetical protein
MHYGHEHTACPIPYSRCMSMCQFCMSQYILHVHVHAAGTWTCSMDTSMQHVVGHAAWTYVHIQYGHEHAAWTHKNAA